MKPTTKHIAIGLLLLAFCPATASVAADDSGKWHIAIFGTKSCQACETLRKHFAEDGPLREWRQWAHFQDYDDADRSQRHRFEDYQVVRMPTLVVMPPLGTRPYDYVFRQAGYDGDQQGLADRLREAIKRFGQREDVDVPPLPQPPPNDSQPTPPNVANPFVPPIVNLPPQLTRQPDVYPPDNLEAPVPDGMALAPTPNSPLPPSNSQLPTPNSQPTTPYQDEPADEWDVGELAGWVLVVLLAMYIVWRKWRPDLTPAEQVSRAGQALSTARKAVDTAERSAVDVIDQASQAAAEQTKTIADARKELAGKPT